MNHTIQLIPATLADYPVIQNMARFYTYDLSGECGWLSQDWALSSDGLYACFDLKNYFEDPSRRAYLIRVNNELAGFVLLNQIIIDVRTDWNVGEFFILAKFQNKGIGSYVTKIIWDQHPGNWEVAVIPENRTALAFWQKTIAQYTQYDYQFETKLARKGQTQPYRVIFTFKTQLRSKNSTLVSQTPKITGLNHITLAVTDIDRSFKFYRDIMEFQPLVKWDKGAYFLVGDLWFCLNVDEKRIPQPCYTHYAFTIAPEQFTSWVERLAKFGIRSFKENHSEGKSFYFLDPDGHKLEIHVGNWLSRLKAKRQDSGSWQQIEWFIE